MKEKAPPSAKWLWRLLSPFTRHRAAVPGKGESTIIRPISTRAISTRAIASAESVLRGISNVPGGERVQVRIGGTLEVIKELNAANAHDTNTLRSLEYYVRYLTELLEPFAMMHRDQIPPLLQYEVLILGRELETASSKMKPAALNQALRWYSVGTKRREGHGGNAPDIRAFTQDFKLALEQFRVNALALYTISPIEAVLRPLGVISNSSCALSSFIEWILKFERTAEYRIGAVRTVKLCYRWGLRHSQRRWDYRFILVGLQNRRQMENWLKIELSGPEMQGTVTFGMTKEALDESLPSSRDRDVSIGEDMLPVTRFSRKIKDVCAQRKDHRILYSLIMDLRKTYMGDLGLRED